MTEKLYWQDPHLASFETRAARIADFQGKAALVLDRTLFYPEGGGQLGDLGTLAIGNVVAKVVDTQIDDGGIIHHVLEAPVSFDAAAPVRGKIDRERRLDHMAQHTAQHALSRALADEARAETVSARLGATSCTIDLARPSIYDAELQKAEDLVNAIIRSDVVVRSHFPTARELAEMPLRRPPKVSDGVRVIEIDGFDFSPCGGTHVTRSGQIGQVRIVALEKYKGGVRLTFHAGLRALADARAKHAALSAAAADLTCGALDVPAAIGRLRADLKTTRTLLDGAREELAGLVAKAMRDALPPASERPSSIVVAVLRASDDMTALRVLAGKLSEDPRIVALAGAVDPETGELLLVVQRGSQGGLDCGAFVKGQAAQSNGRGGGKPERAEGRFPRATSLDVLAAAASAALQTCAGREKIH
jgi:alanyl-tRNA synthetase